MAETKILEGENPKGRNAAKTQLLENDNVKETLVTLGEQNKRKINKLKLAGGLLAGAAAGAVLFSFAPAPEEGAESTTENGDTNAVPLPDEPALATTVTDSMSFNQAFEEARSEVGAGGYFEWRGKLYGTYYKDEWSLLSQEEKNEFYNNVMNNGGADIIEQNHTPASEPIHITQPHIIYEEAPEAVGVSDAMSFNDAFAVAREEVGPGGVFQWNGNYYSTYTAEEWNSMSDAEKLAYQQSVSEFSTDICCDHEGVVVGENEIIDFPSSNVAQELSLLASERVTLDDGSIVTVGSFQNTDGSVEYRVDMNNDGNFDYIYNEKEDSFTNINTGEQISVSNEAVEPTPIGSQEMEIEGHLALVTAMSDGSVVADIDSDGDGVHDAKVQMTADGHIYAFDENGTVIHEDQVVMDENESLFNDGDSNIYIATVEAEPFDSPEGIESNLVMDNDIEMDIQNDHIAYNDDFYHTDPGMMDSGFDNNMDMEEWA